MSRLNTDRIKLEYERFGSTTRDCIVLIRGLGSQLIHWPDSLIKGLVKQGLQVVIFDNRDAGLSEKIGGYDIEVMQALIQRIKQGENPSLPYRLIDMATDVLDLMDALDILQAHIVGASMGGMIAHRFAATWPKRVLSLTSIFSTSGDPILPPGADEAWMWLERLPVVSGDQEQIIAKTIDSWQVFGSPAYPQDRQTLYPHVKQAHQRCYCPDGYLRQYAALLAEGSQVEILRTIQAPSLVLHGDGDPIFPIAHAQSIAENIPKARLRTIPGWGHDIPEQVVPTLVDEISRHISLQEI